MIADDDPDRQPAEDAVPLRGDAGLLFGEAPDGRMLAVADVPRGIACGLVCPECRARLVARKGGVLRHHLAHEGGLGCDGACETMLHKLAKQIIADAGRVHLPSVGVRSGQRVRIAVPAQQVAFDRVALEARQDGFRPDIIGYKRDRALAIEVRVTHGCGPDKIRLIRERQVATLEIDLSTIGRDASYATLQTMVLRRAARRWLFHPKEATPPGQFRQGTLARQAAAPARAVRHAGQDGHALADTAAAARMQQIRAGLLRQATVLLGPDAGAAWMGQPILTDIGISRQSANEQSDPAYANDYWIALRHQVALAGGPAGPKARTALRTAASRRFQSEARAALWLGSANPALAMKSPDAACSEPGGLKRCLALLAKVAR